MARTDRHHRESVTKPMAVLMDLMLHAVEAQGHIPQRGKDLDPVKITGVNFCNFHSLSPATWRRTLSRFEELGWITIESATARGTSLTIHDRLMDVGVKELFLMFSEGADDEWG